MKEEGLPRDVLAVRMDSKRHSQSDMENSEKKHRDEHGRRKLEIDNNLAKEEQAIQL